MKYEPRVQILIPPDQMTPEERISEIGIILSQAIERQVEHRKREEEKRLRRLEELKLNVSVLSD